MDGKPFPASPVNEGVDEQAADELTSGIASSWWNRPEVLDFISSSGDQGCSLNENGDLGHNPGVNEKDFLKHEGEKINKRFCCGINQSKSTVTI